MPLDQEGHIERNGEIGAARLKRRYFSAINSFSVKVVADRHRYVAYYNKHWQQAS